MLLSASGSCFNVQSKDVYFSETELAGAFVVEPASLRNERGYFARVFVRAGVRRARTLHALRAGQPLVERAAGHDPGTALPTPVGLREGLQHTLRADYCFVCPCPVKAEGHASAVR
jgi:hypothetical protein